MASTFADLESPLYAAPEFHIDAPDADPASEIQRLGKFRAQMRIHAPAVMIAGVPNAAKRGQWALNQARKEGLYSGFPDIMCLAAGPEIESGFTRPLIAFLEWKAGRTKPGEHQVDCLNLLHRMGFAVGVFRRADSAMQFLRAQGFPFLDQRHG